MMCRIAIIGLCLLLYRPDNVTAALKISTGNGIWTTGGTWFSSGVPACGDSIVIQSGHVVTINNQQDYTGCGSILVIVIYGQLDFGNGDKLKLPCGSRIYVFPGGSITGAGGGGASNTIDVCGTTFWDASQGNLSGPACVPATLPTCSGVLPVLLVHLEAEPCLPSICLYWQTAVERRNDYFQIEKLFDEEDWHEIGRVNSAAKGGSSLKPLDYYFQDESPHKGVNYYRLIQTDVDRAAILHGIVFAEFESDIEIQPRPNPSEGSFGIDLEGSGIIEAGILTIYELSGRELANFYFAERPRSEIKIEWKDAYPGIFYGVFSCGKVIKRFKLLIL